MKTLTSFFAALLALSFSATAQKEDNVWIFAGNRIDFNTTPPTVTPTACDYVTEENITSVSDRYGNLVYWLNGKSLYNSRDEVVYSLPVGNDGFYFYGLSIVPFPGRENVFLFVYPDAKSGSMVVSIADGSEDLLHPKITERYNEFPFYYPQSSKYTPDGVPLFFQKYGSRDFWLLYSWFNKIKVYALTADGFTYTGNEYKVPQVFGDSYNIDGCEMTPDRSKILATTASWTKYFFIDLDTKTGEIKKINPIEITCMEAFAFSSGNKYMFYASQGKLYRIPVETLGRISKVREFMDNSEYVGDLGCGMGDVKFLASGGIYFLNEDDGGYIGRVWDCDSEHPVINNKWLRLAKNVHEHKAKFEDAMPKTYCYPYGFTAAEQCGGEVHFAYTDDNDYASLLWNFGDGTSSTDPAPVHSYTANGKYTVSITINYNSTDRPTRIVTQDVFVNNIPKKLVIVRE